MQFTGICASHMFSKYSSREVSAQTIVYSSHKLTVQLILVRKLSRKTKQQKFVFSKYITTVSRNVDFSQEHIYQIWESCLVLPYQLWCPDLLSLQMYVYTCVCVSVQDFGWLNPLKSKNSCTEFTKAFMTPSGRSYVKNIAKTFGFVLFSLKTTN